VSSPAGRAVIDRETGEASVWPYLPVPTVVRLHREAYPESYGDSPRAPRSADQAAQARRDLRRVVTPATVTHLSMVVRLAEGEHLAKGERPAEGERVQVSRSVKGDADPDHHPLVLEFLLRELPAEARERGHERCSEAAALSDALHAEDARRAAAGQEAVTLAEARTELFAGADLVTYRVRERGDPVAGHAALPCVSCLLLARHFGFDLVAADTAADDPADDAETGPEGADD
jgi:hypothetical protein